MSRHSSTRSYAAPRLAWICVAILFALIPTRAAAQKDAFIEAFIEFHTRLAGTYGDEGPGAARALDRMDAALSAWDDINRESEAKLESAPGSASNLALFYLDAGRPSDALSAIDAAIQIEPTRAGLHMFRGVVLDAAGRIAEALQSLQTAWDLDHNDPIAAYLLAARIAAGPDPVDVQPQLAALLAIHQRSGASPRRRAPFLRASLIDDLAADMPRFAPAAYAEGFSRFLKGRYRDAVTSFRAALAGDPLVTDPALRSNQVVDGVSLLRQGSVAQAIARLEVAVASAASSSEVHRILGAAYGVERSVGKSVEHLTAALLLAPDNERARTALGRVLLEAGRTEDAERTLHEGLAVLPASGRLHWVLADVYQTRGDGAKTIRALEDAATLIVPAGKAGLYWRLANVAYLLQDPARVVSALARRAAVTPNDAGAHKSLGLAYHRTGRPNRAMIELITSSLLGFEDAETLATMGQIHLTAGRYDAAEGVLRRAVVFDPGFPDARYALGRTLLHLGKTDEGRRQLAEFQRLRNAQLDDHRKLLERERQKSLRELAEIQFPR